MKKLSWLAPVSILIFVLVTLVFLSPLVFSEDSTWFIKKRLNLGLDLKGGTQTVLTVNTTGMSEKDAKEAVDGNMRIIRSRIDQFGVAEPVIQRSGENDILVQLPGVKNPRAAADLLTKSAELVFKLVVSGEDAQRFVDQVDGILQSNLSSFPELAKLEAEYREIDKKESKMPKQDVAEDNPNIADTEETEEAEEREYVSDGSSGVFKSLLTDIQGDFAVRFDDYELMLNLLNSKEFQNIKPKGYDLVLNNVDEDMRKAKAPVVLYVLKSTAEVMGTDLDSASMEIGSSGSHDPRMAGKPFISLSFTTKGARKFANVTGDNIKERLAIVVDNTVYSAPVIQDRIGEGKATITGQFTMDEARSLAILLNNKSLSAPIEVKSSNQVSATLGADSVKSGLMAGLIGIIAVVIFMLIYYKLSGLLANIALVFNVGFILAMLTAFGGTLTMPGIAGIILTIGMAVDANVLIFERIREELEAGKNPRSAADAGFKRATITIWDANLTTLIAAFVLYQFGTGPVRGFALTLTIGIVSSIFTAIVFVRWLMDKTLLSRNREKLSI
ncbi:MAG: protein translocase subunit SecD [Candidatus Cloacimonadaceae bacterium]|jgi:protein-export membrane protein SecD|nr:protein translocase subunit SecD [Candidatus Cloacimonadota bacterium]MDX9949817.1 protein translocase subunit SecD [Candidatus Syntrophosphaera sp.]